MLSCGILPALNKVAYVMMTMMDDDDEQLCTNTHTLP